MPSKTSYIEPNASEGLPQAHEIMAFQSNGNPSASVATATGSDTPWYNSGIDVSGQSGLSSTPMRWA